MQGYLAHRKQQTPLQDHQKARGKVLLQGPREALFLISEVPLQSDVQGKWPNKQLKMVTGDGSGTKLSTFTIVSLFSRPTAVHTALQGYLAHKKHPPPRTLQ
jgi:hypothetical protein